MFIGSCFHVSCQDFIFYQSPGVAPGRNRRDARANDANQAILAEDADLQSGDGERLEEFLSGICLGSRWVDVCLLNELGIGGEYSRNMAGLTFRLGVPLTCEFHSLILAARFGGGYSLSI